MTTKRFWRNMDQHNRFEDETLILRGSPERSQQKPESLYDTEEKTDLAMNVAALQELLNREEGKEAKNNLNRSLDATVIETKLSVQLNALLGTKEARVDSINPAELIETAMGMDIDRFRTAKTVADTIRICESKLPDVKKKLAQEKDPQKKIQLQKQIGSLQLLHKALERMITN